MHGSKAAEMLQKSDREVGEQHYVWKDGTKSPSKTSLSFERSDDVKTLVGRVKRYGNVVAACVMNVRKMMPLGQYS